MNEAIIWAVCSLILGAAEALVFARSPKLRARFRTIFEFEIDSILQTIRGVFFIVVFWGASWLSWLGWIPAACLLFPFFHDGAYYQVRHWIDGKYKGFRDHSQGQGENMAMDFFGRCVLLIAGIALTLFIVL